MWTLLDSQGGKPLFPNLDISPKENPTKENLLLDSLVHWGHWEIHCSSSISLPTICISAYGLNLFFANQFFWLYLLHWQYKEALKVRIFPLNDIAITGHQNASTLFLSSKARMSFSLYSTLASYLSKGSLPFILYSASVPCVSVSTVRQAQSVM